MLKFGKFFTSAMLLSLLIGGNALAATSSTTISSNESSAYGGSISVSLGTNTKLYGSNYSSSTNSVYVQKIRAKTGPDEVRDEFLIGPGVSKSNTTVTGVTGKYHVGMNPKGALSKGVNGSAYLTDNY